MQYDSTDLAERYHRARALTSTDVDRWVRLVQDVLPRPERVLVLDLGCGTGRFSVALAEQLGVSVIGVDPSPYMLRQAVRDSRSRAVAYREGRAEAIPVGAHAAALIFMSNAIHHVTSLDDALREMRRVLERHGVVFIRNYSLENLASLAYLRFFPEAMDTSQTMLWRRRTLIEQFAASGFVLVSQGTVQQEASPDIESYFRKIERRVYSDLALISDLAFEQGFARMRGASAAFGDGPVLEEVDYFVFRRADDE